jgi:DNA-directed RNA polymerase subunit RPC12/RpoP
LFISDPRELGYEYLAYKGDNFIRCADCGILTRGNKNGTKRYCKDCSGYTPQETKIITCVDCGKEVFVSPLNTKTNRCPNCQSIIDREKARIRKQNQRLKEKMSR